MSFFDINHLKHRYNSANVSIVRDFYNNVLNETVRYDRIAGFFNSSSLAVAAYGMANFIKNNGHMRLLCSAELNPDDLNSINNSNDLKDLIDSNFLNDFEKIEDELILNHVKMLGWMISNDYLEIKVGVNKKNGNFTSGSLHSKIGILYDDEGNYISFDGSVNETAFGWDNNIESLKVFYGWENPEYIDEDIEDFEDFWNNNNDSLEVFDVPYATKNKLINIAPNDFHDLNLSEFKRDEHYTIPSDKLKLRGYQDEAIQKWFNNGKKGILSMATGTGKTFTALSCFEILDNQKDKLLTVIVCPQIHLISQWFDNLKKFNGDWKPLFAYGNNKNWKLELIELINDMNSGLKSHQVILTTFDTFCNVKFTDKMKFYDGEILLIVDEVHGIGAQTYRKGLLENYTYRLGLSATPEIEDDFDRTEFVYDYFGDVVYTYDLKKAIDNGYLCHYKYYPEFVDLNKKELEKYKENTFKIASLMGKIKNSYSSEKEKDLTALLNQRRAIVNNAESKLTYLRKFLKENKNIKDLIIYCSGEQLPQIEKILDDFNIDYHKFTGEESTKKDDNGKSQRDKILNLFAEGYYKVLLGIKCLDEGVDVPSTQNAILMSSTLNSRQHIQRRGRLLRNSPGKEIANIYDLIVFPKIKFKEESVMRIFKNEERRYVEYSDIADNYEECSRKLINKMEEIL